MSIRSRQIKEEAATQAANEKRRIARHFDSINIQGYGVNNIATPIQDAKDAIQAKHVHIEPVNAVRVQSDKEVSARMTQERNDWIDASINHARIQTQRKV